MRSQFIAVCAIVFVAICGTLALRAEATEISVRAPLVLAHEGHDMGDEAAAESGWGHFVSWVGHFHPPLTVFPIAMILSAALAELLRIWMKSPWLGGASRWCMIVGGVGAAITAPLGWAFAAHRGHSWILEVHRWLGTAAGIGAVVLLILSEIAWRRGGGALTLFRVVLFIAVPLVMATGFFGGAMVYGLHEYDWNQAAHHRDEAAHASEGASGGSSASSGETEVTMTNDATFKPDQVTVDVGATVRWRNGSKDAHTVTDDPNAATDEKDVSSPAGAKTFNSGKIQPGGAFEQKFTVAGTYQYVCEPHEDMGMKGKVIVKAKGK